MDRLPRFYFEPNALKGELISIKDEQTSHISRSLRMHVGDEAIFFNGVDSKFKVELIEVNRHKVIGSIKERLTLNIPQKRITLIQSLPMGKKMDLIVKKLTEIGISAIIPLDSEFSQLHVKDVRKKKERWESLVIESCKQSERDIFLKIADPITFDQLGESIKDYDLKLIAHKSDSSENLKEVLNTEFKNVVYMIGPEGGFSPKEIEKASDLGFKHVVINQNILRTETAAIFLGSILSFAS